MRWIAFLIFFWIGLAPVAAADEERAAAFQRIVSPFFGKYCVDCHGEKDGRGGVSVVALKAAVAEGPGPKQWDRVLEVLERGTMPPEDAQAPEAEERKSVAAWIRSALRAEAALPDKEKPAGLRRLTNPEYANTLRELLGLDLDYAAELTKDPAKAYRFNNTAEFMKLGPEQIEAYHAVARRAMASAIVDPTKPTLQKTRKEWKPTGIPAGDERMEPAYVGVYPGGRFSVTQGMDVGQFPKTGEFRIRFQASGIFPAGIREMPLRLVMGEGCNRVNLSTKRIVPVGTVRLKAGAEPQVFEFRGRIENYPVEIGLEVKGKRKPDTLVITPQNLYDDGTLNDENGFRKPRMREFPIAVVDWIEFESPVNEVWPPAHHTNILIESPLRETEPEKYVREVLRRFVSRAFRRPATDDEVERFGKIYAVLKPELKSMEATLRETLSLVLISPQFLLHHESAETPESGRQYALASRLSYFLWGSMPDAELGGLAAKGELDKPDVIERQVLRLLADPRADASLREFTRQWLSLDKMRTVPINRDLFPRFLYYVPLGERAWTEEPYRPTIRDHMIAETQAFVAHLVRSNLPAGNLVESDFAFLNQALAAHYGVPGVDGDELRKVPLEPEHHLGGLLTHGSILIGNGTGSAPHPIYRAVWLREAILGEDVPPPPADVPALVDTAGASAEKASTIKQLLVRHRQQASCNACHARLDPWGIPFEEYNAIGRFQPKLPKEGTRVAPFKTAVHKSLGGYNEYLANLNTIAVDATAQVPHGPAVAGMAELKAYLLKDRHDDVARNVLKRFYSYALGRELTWRDRYALDAMMSETAKGGHRLRDMIVTIGRQEPFRNPTPEAKP